MELLDEDGHEASNKVEKMSKENSGLSSKTTTRLSSLIWTNFNLQVIGEAPEEAPNSVTNPEHGVYQHWLVVLLTHPVILE